MNKLFFLFICLCVVGCASQERKDQLAIRLLYKNNEFEHALSALEKSKIKKESKNHLLYLMEKGKIHFAEGHFAEASDIFHEANDLVDKLYTKKITQKILSAIGNDNSENYYGSILERSMLYFYLALSNVKIYEQGFIQKRELAKDGKPKWVKHNLVHSDRRKYLFRARAAVVAWNGFFDEVQRVNTETTLYQNDLMGKIFAASVHELVGERTDINIALQLYKDAKKVLEIQGPSYKQFNEQYKIYSQNIYEQLEKGKVNPKKEWIQSSPEYQTTKDYIDYKILSLTRKYSSRSYKKELKQIDPSDWVKAMLQEKELPNTTIFVERSVSQPMEAEEFEYSLNSAVENIEDPGTRAVVQGIGLPVLTLFAMGPLGLGYMGKSGSTYIYTQHNLGTAVMGNIAIGFEMPIVKDVPQVKPKTLKVYKLDEKGSKTLYKTLPLALTGPINDLAMQAASERAAASYTKVGVKVAIKHLIAIIAAYKTYESMKQGNGEFLARGIAFAQYMASSRAIMASEKADIRFWSTLPANIYQSSFYLPPGKYQVVEEISGVEKSGKVLGQLEIAAKGMNFFSSRL